MKIDFDLQPKRMYKWLKEKRKKGLNVTENDKVLQRPLID